MRVVVAVFIVFIVEVNAGIALVCGFVMSLKTWSVCGVYVNAVVGEYT
jgi:hypothetical protein